MVNQCFDNDLSGYYIQESYEYFGLSYICMYKWIHDKWTVKRKEEVTLEWLQKQKAIVDSKSNLMPSKAV